jgi:isopentenyldiphosphate isomerase
MEFLDVLDKEGNYTGQIEERAKIHKLNIPHWEVVILLVNSKGQTLLQKRSKDKIFYPNCWGVCSGHVDAGEESIHAALR